MVISAWAWCWLEYKLPFGDNKDCFTDLSTVTAGLNTFLYLAQGFIEHARRSVFAGETYRAGRERLLLISYKTSSVVLRAMEIHSTQDSSKAKMDSRIGMRWFFPLSHCYQTCQFWKPQKDRRPSLCATPWQHRQEAAFPNPTRAVCHSSRSFFSPMPRLLLLPPLAYSSPLFGESLISTLQSHTAPVLHSA